MPPEAANDNISENNISPKNNWGEILPNIAEQTESWGVTDETRWVQVSVLDYLLGNIDPGDRVRLMEEKRAANDNSLEKEKVA